MKLELLLVFAGGIAVLAVFNVMRAWRLLRDHDDACDLGGALAFLFRPAPPLERATPVPRAELEDEAARQRAAALAASLAAPRVEGGAT